MSGSLLTWFSDYLTDRKHSSLTSVKAGVTQGSIIRPLLFLLYVNGIVVDINSSIRPFGDYTSMYIIVDYPN